jgi:hypothetical protein
MKLRTHLRARRYFGPSFSNSASTQSEMVGIPTHCQLIPSRSRSSVESEPDSIWYRQLTLRHQAVHHPLDELDLVLDGKVDKVGIHQDAVRWAEVGIVRKEETGGVSALSQTLKLDGLINA